MLKIFITLAVLLIIALVSGVYGYYQIHARTESEAVVPTHYLEHGKASIRFSLCFSRIYSIGDLSTNGIHVT